jgi:hypothetical protein
MYRAKPRRAIARIALAAIASSALIATAARAAILAVSHKSPPVATKSVVISPLAGTPDANPKTQISFLGAPRGALSAISVRGSRSGAHNGRLESYVSTAGASFLPRRPFLVGETVIVHAKVRTKTGTHSIGTRFQIGKVAPFTSNPFPRAPRTPATVQSFASRPDLQPNAIGVITPAQPGTQPGDIFLSPTFGPGQDGPMIIDGAGRLVWFKPLPTNVEATDFRVQRYRGRSVLTWYQGPIYSLGFGQGIDQVYDNSYRRIATVHAGNGLQADLHDFQLTSHDTALITAYFPVSLPKAYPPAPAGQTVLDSVFQEIDLRTGLVMFEWHSLGRVAIGDSHSPLPPQPASPYDYFHINSVDQDPAGDFLISARNTWGVYKINRSGSFAWQLGGPHSTFTLGPNVQFAFQHDARFDRDGTISLFDDESPTPSSPLTVSRGIIIRISTATKTATLVSQDVRPPLRTASQGSFQALPNGNRFMAQGGLPNFTEFKPDGTIVFDATLPARTFSYRVERFGWAGRPTDKPAVAATTTASGATVSVSWNGATDVSSWDVFGGDSPQSVTRLATVPSAGFETQVPVASSGPYFVVRALDRRGRVLATSATIKA